MDSQLGTFISTQDTESLIFIWKFFMTDTNKGSTRNANSIYYEVNRQEVQRDTQLVYSEYLVQVKLLNINNEWSGFN
jgi:hypothetical protein